MLKKNKTIIAVVFVVFGVLLRLVPHPANMTPIAAVALFAGVYLSRRWSMIIPMAIMMISDLLMSFAFFRNLIPWGANGAGWHNLAPIVWLCFALVGLIGWWVAKHKSAKNILLGSLAGSVVFYLVTNWAVWAFGTMYPANFAGLLESYTMALPFFRNSLVGNIAYTTVLFGLYESVPVFGKMRKRKEITVSN
ncbi:MAG: DUF6580 family putative transport protein [bacterium]